MRRDSVFRSLSPSSAISGNPLLRALLAISAPDAQCGIGSK
jgi:hypothetical protein